MKKLIFFFALLSTCVAAAVAEPLVLPKPDGPFHVGMRQFELSGPDGRPLPAFIWYPAADAREVTRPYMSADDAAVQIPSLAQRLERAPEYFSNLASGRVHSIVNASPVRSQRKFPILIFNHGYRLYPTQNSVLVEQLASHGYIVISIAHLGDAIDMKLANGTVAKLRISSSPNDARFMDTLQKLAVGDNNAVRTKALSQYDEAFANSRLGRSFPVWRENNLFIAEALTRRSFPPLVQKILDSGDRRRLGIVGMSFGGVTSATSCRLISVCRVAVNLDGQNMDPAMFNRPSGKPLLLLLSDWPRYPAFTGQSSDPAFSPNDYAYEYWIKAGLDRNIVRVRLDGIRHMGFSDLIGLLPEPTRGELAGDIKPDRAFAATNDVVLAFLNHHLAGSDASVIDEAIKRNPELHRHIPQQLRAWAQDR